MTSLVIINEDFWQMSLGTNSSLFLIVEALKAKNDLLIFNLAENELPQDQNSSISGLFLGKNAQNSLDLVEKYEFFNEKLINFIKNKDFYGFLSHQTPKLWDFMGKFPTKAIKIKDFDDIIQRLEPMKKPFPPAGEANIDDVLVKIQQLFPNKKVHLPIALNDKILPLRLNEILSYEIATPTFLTDLDDTALKTKIDKIITKHQEINGTTTKKIVVKPVNAAQSLGVFAIDFGKNGFDLSDIKQKTVKELKEAQILHIKHDLSDSNLLEILQILCFVQEFDSNDKIENFSNEEIINNAKRLYTDEILIQPFIDGVSNGDVRVNVIRDNNHKFYAGGYVFRKSLQHDDNFTTCFSGGKAISLPISYLSETEQQNLTNKTNEILEVLNNGELKDYYDNVLELGFDFLLVGNKKDILLGEINHHCPALLPISSKLQ